MLRASRLRGFTLVELLAVVAIIGVLVALVVPAVGAARESARRSQCQNNLRQLGVGTALHANAHAAFPVGCVGRTADFTVSPPVVARLISWNVQLLPFLEEQPTHREFDFSLPSYHASNKAVSATVVETFLCPSTVQTDLHILSGLWKGAAYTDYAGIYGVEGTGRDRPEEEEASLQTLRDDSLGILLYDEAVAPRHVTDGLSNTASIAETSFRRQAESEWVNGENIFSQEEATPINGDGLNNEIGSPHAGGALLAFCDAHVEFVAETIDQAALVAKLTKEGGD